MTDKQKTNHAFARSRSNAGLGLPQFCTVRNMNWTGEVLHGKFDGTYYVLEDGDCYLPETLHHYADAICQVEFSDSDPCMPNVKVRGRPLLGDPS